LPSGSWQGSGGPIVLCWRPTSWLQGERWRPLLKALSELAMRHQREVIWVPFHQEQDRGLLAELIQQGLIPADLATRSREQRVETVEEASALFERAGLVLAMRLHGLILAALAGSPCAALSYDPKVAAAAQAITCPCGDLAENLTADALLHTWQRQLDQPQDPSTVARLRAGTAVHQELLCRFSTS
jgi:polysaccharide pyruvyl transferase WcaK-like protein